MRAIIVYPMNALINSQDEAIRGLLANLGDDRSPITWRRYTGQESDREKQEIQQNPPHILLTNYVMLELMLTRPEERPFVDRTAAALEFLVLDEHEKNVRLVSAKMEDDLIRRLAGSRHGQ